MKVICISGKAQHGKDTTAGFMKEFLEERGKKVLICHYGDLVKYVCTTFFGWDGVKDEAGRSILQRVGTDVIRTQEPDYWVSFIGSILELFPDEWDYVLIPDCRFPNEINVMRDFFDMEHIRVIRDNPNWTSPLTEEQQKHPSETALDDYFMEGDTVIHNAEGLEELRKVVEHVVRTLDTEFTEADAIKFWGESE